MGTDLQSAVTPPIVTAHPNVRIVNYLPRTPGKLTSYTLSATYRLLQSRYSSSPRIKFSAAAHAIYCKPPFGRKSPVLNFTATRHLKEVDPCGVDLNHRLSMVPRSISSYAITQVLSDNSGLSRCQEGIVPHNSPSHSLLPVGRRRTTCSHVM